MCIHDCFGSGISVFDREAKVLRGYVICDGCGERIQDVYSQDYFPDPLITDDPTELQQRAA